MPATTVTRDALGAWLVRCNPDVWDIIQFVEDGNVWVDDWTVQDNYRSDLMRIGDPIVLWVAAGPRRRATPGVWGVGHVVGRARGSTAALDESETDDQQAGDLTPALIVGTPEDDEPPAIGYWLDALAASRARYGIPVDIPLLESPLAKQVVESDAVLSKMEVMRQPQMGNPSWLTKSEWDRLLQLLPDDSWEPMTTRTTEAMRALDGEAAPDADTRLALDTLSMAAVLLDLRETGWWASADDVTDQGWDVAAERDGIVRHLRVVGTTLHSPEISLLPSEYEAAATLPYWELAVVTRCLSQPKVHYFPASAVLSAARPALYQLDLATAHGQ